MMTGRLRTSRAGLELIKSFEGFREGAVRLPDGRWTIGYGHVRTAREGLTISQKDAEDLLIYDLRPVEDAIHSMVFAPLNQNQFDALVSLTLNISPGQFRDSDILRLLNGGDFLSAANAFDLWRKARIHGRVMIVDALVRRRAAEKAMFLEHPDGRPTAPTPLVTPEQDFGSNDPPSRAAVNEAVRQPPPEPEPLGDDDQYGRPPSSDIAEAVRRLAERANDMVTAPPQPASPPRTEAPPASQSAPVTPAQPEPTKSADDMRREVADRVARILERTERAIAEQQPAQPAVQPVQQTALRAEVRPAPRPATPPVMPTPVSKKAEREIPEDLPDFDAPPPRAPSAKPVPNGRTLIDDTEMFDPGRDPSEMFAEAERKAKVVNGRSRNLGPVNGRLATLLPWVALLTLSVLVLVIGVVEGFKVDGANWGPTVLALGGALTVMSVYFLFTRASDDA